MNTWPRLWKPTGAFAMFVKQTTNVGYLDGWYGSLSNRYDPPQQ